MGSTRHAAVAEAAALTALDSQPGGSRQRTRAAALLYGSAGLLVIMATAMSGGRSVPILMGCAGFALVTAVVLYVVGERRYVPVVVNEALSLSGSLLIGVAVGAADASVAGAYGIFVVYVAAYSVYFFPARVALLHTAVAGVAYGGGLAFGAAELVIAPWLVVVLGSVVAAALMGALARVDRRAVEDERRAAMAAQRLAEVKDLLLTAVSHELRTPLQVIAGSAETMSARRADLGSADLIGLLDSQRRNTTRLVRLVEDLDALHQLGHGALSPSPQRVGLRSLLSDIISESSAASHTVHLEVAQDGDVALDPRFARRIVGNLVRNAVRHTTDGTPVEVVGAVVRDWLVVEVIDHGQGIPDDMKLAVFEPFVRIHHERPGSGVGLALVSALTRAHGGRISVRDTDGGGCRFRVELPAGASASATAPAADPAAPPSDPLAGSDTP